MVGKMPIIEFQVGRTYIEQMNDTRSVEFGYKMKNLMG